MLDVIHNYDARQGVHDGEALASIVARAPWMGRQYFEAMAAVVEIYAVGMNGSEDDRRVRDAMRAFVKALQEYEED